MAWYNLFSRRDRDDVADGEETTVQVIVSGARDKARTGPGRKLPRFHGSARELGDSDLGPNSARARVRDAFTPSQPVRDVRLFAGREQVMQTLIRSIEDLRLHVVIYGERGMGKTSLLHILTKLATEAHYHVAYHSCGEGASFVDTFRAIAADIPLLYHDRHDPTADETERGGTLADLLPAGDFGVNQLSEVFSHLSNTRVVIILDEFDRSPAGSFRRSIAELIKNLSDRSVRVQLVIAGVAANLAEFVEHIPSIRRNIFGLQMPSMTAEEVEDMIRIGEEISGLHFEPQTIERIILIANGSPYLASMLSQYAGFCALDDQSAQVTVQHVASATRLAVDELRHRISTRSLEAVDRAVAQGHGIALSQLAGLAMKTMGRLNGDKIASFAADSATDSPASLLITSELLEAIPNEPDRRYHFKEEGVPTYVWLLFASEGNG